MFTSTDTELDTMTIIDYYKARFQIEFLFRDAKKYTGFTHCQSRKKEATHTHLNASLSALNVLKLEDQRLKGRNDRTVISIISWKHKKWFCRKV
ncbi:transposase [Zooshikella sp. RANM57]|uniref:transposase n=1 Tax=Zooshikella sp. RANM57 TaxID=3425863 RepID=UPI003D6F6520